MTFSINQNVFLAFPRPVFLFSQSWNGVDIQTRAGWNSERVTPQPVSH